MSLVKYSGFLGLAAYAVVTLALTADIPPPACADGWQSPSIGSTGACSHHGGVNYHTEQYFSALIFGALSGLFVYFVGSFIEKRLNTLKVPRLDPNLLGGTEVISHAIRHNLTIEFTYRKPGLPATTRNLVPTDLSYISHQGRHAVLCVTGFCLLRQKQRTFAVSRISDVRIPGA